mmetsp:Transcript_35292/g.49144  ORF Transcript_35292/g.49144 Transcript_35292/m.49144 type:complete len:84 (-) Transcript_35292:1712-1963(-)
MRDICNFTQTLLVIKGAKQNLDVVLGKQNMKYYICSIKEIADDDPLENPSEFPFELDLNQLGSNRPFWHIFHQPPPSSLGPSV